MKTPRLAILSGVLVWTAVMHAQSVIPALQSRFEQASQARLSEKLFVQTDKDIYTPGENLWLSLYAVDGMFNKPLDLSSAAYVELLDAGNHPAVQVKIALRSGRGGTGLTIPATLATGNYRLRAYTQWMKNSGPESFFEKTITILNYLKRPDWSLRQKETDYDIQLLPEGGQLVTGLPATIGFKIVDANGKGVEAPGELFSGSDTIVHFSTMHHGMGRFEFTPQEGKVYSAVFHLSGSGMRKVDLPVASPRGFALHVHEEANVFSVLVASSEQRGAVSLVVQTRGALKDIQTANVSAGRASFTIPKNRIGDGVSDIVLLDDQLQPVSERLIFKQPADRLNLSLTGSAAAGIREQVAISIAAKNAVQQLVSADLSLSVYLVDSLPAQPAGDIRSYFWLESELLGEVEDPLYYFNTVDTTVSANADLLMLTQGWRKFINQSLTPGAPSEFFPEHNGTYAYGRIVKKSDGLPLAGIPLFFSSPGSDYILTTAVSDTQGRFNFNISNLFGNREVVIEALPKDSGDYRIELLSPYSTAYDQRKLPGLNFYPADAAALSRRSLSGQVQSAFITREQQQYSSPALLDSTVFFGKPDKKYFLEDYTRFRTMEEVMREYVPEVRVRKHTDGYHFTSKNLPYQLLFEEEPLILLDGVPVSNADQMIEFDPLKIQKLQVVARTFYTGPVAHAGIVAYSTYHGDLAGFKLPANALVTNYPGLAYERAFYSPSYVSAAARTSHQPDFRNVLQWEPQIKTDQNGKAVSTFYTSDIPGKYLILVEGISPSGLAGSAWQVLNVHR